MSYRHINAKERYCLQHLLQWGLSYREIGRRLNRHHTSIERLGSGRPLHTNLSDVLIFINTMLFQKLTYRSTLFVG